MSSSISSSFSHSSSFIMDRIKGMFYALALGDAKGVPFEFRNISPKLTYTPIMPSEDIVIQFRWNSVTMKAYSPSDDTEMTLALLFGFLQKGMKYDWETVLIEYMKCAKQTRTIGKNTRALLKGVKTIKGYTNRMSKVEQDQKEIMQSNGSLMRASSLALMKNWNAKTCELDTSLTNPNRLNQTITVLFVSLLRILLCGGTKEECKDLCKDCLSLPSSSSSYLISDSHNVNNISNKSQIINNLPESVKQAINDSFDEKTQRKLTHQDYGKGWVCNSFYIALKAFWMFDNFESAMQYVIAEHPGSDTDTNASICGALFGAWLGLDKLNECTITRTNLIHLNEFWSNKYTGNYKLSEDLFEYLKQKL